MQKTDIKHFLEKGDILTEKRDIQKINELKRDCDEFWVCIATFKYDGFSIEFILNDTHDEIIGEQIKVWNQPNNAVLRHIYLLVNAEKNLSTINAVYYDDTDESVIFLENGINIHYNSGELSLITFNTKHDRKLISDTMIRKKPF